MMGIDTDRVIASTFFIGSVLAGAAGVMFGLLFSQVFHFMGFLAGLKGFTAAVVGGIGSIPGAMLGGLLVGLAEAYASGYSGGRWSELIVFGILIFVLLVRPSGLLGTRGDPEGLMEPTATTRRVGVRRAGSPQRRGRMGRERARRGRRRARSGRIDGCDARSRRGSPSSWSSPRRCRSGWAEATSSPTGSSRCSTSCSASGSTSSSATPGLLDLGYVAFFGFGAYFYAPALFRALRDPLVGCRPRFPSSIVGTALLGLVLGIPSRRLLGDYLAIVTLFFGQAFVVFVNAANPTVRGQGPDRRAERDRRHRPARLLRLRADDAEASSTTSCSWPSSLVLVGAPLLERVAHRTCLARAARGSARGRGDDASRSTASS